MKTALITGASSGIGETFAKELAARKTNLVLVARSEDKLHKLANQVESKYQIQTNVIVQDLTASAAAKSIFEVVLEQGLTIDLLVNNAGFGDYGNFTQRPLEKQVNMIQLNITALVELTYLFLGRMQQRQSGGIINVASIGGFQPLPYMSVYGATKAFVLSFSEALWAENRDSGVKIFALCPGPTESDFFKKAEFPEFAREGSEAKLTSAQNVVRDALEALEKDKSNVVTGEFLNQVIVNTSRFLPRETLVSLVEKQFKGLDSNK
ncbi:short-chain dehydrogenase/reductase SDR [Trichodesmium erythraeum IMS101]|uniref:Short-chain dehydrogenase/reductase SDR n=1 Tax=Trichodesmium erythraeum (strain IMS101) TaxID=203124 RepID=Q114M0_TRIEI|nr:SDR family oxidoreductase [Trichodesmium erythraeum GBRTRLIN201]MDT9340459.1 SDR family oxidoreductase [Trichodesmium erythraeum 21-75]